MKFLPLVLGCTILYGHATAQLSADSVSILLSGKTKKEWVVSPWKSIMGAAAKCKGGESYIFYNGGGGQHKQCLDGRPVNDSLRWSVIQKGDDLQLVINGLPYQLRPKQGADNEIQLRHLVADKAHPEMVTVLKYERY